jgi:hypothetical protein
VAETSRCSCFGGVTIRNAGGNILSVVADANTAGSCSSILAASVTSNPKFCLFGDEGRFVGFCDNFAVCPILGARIKQSQIRGIDSIAIVSLVLKALVVPVIDEG